MLLGVIGSVKSSSVLSKLANSLECLKIPLKVISWIFLGLLVLIGNKFTSLSVTQLRKNVNIKKFKICINLKFILSFVKYEFILCRTILNYITGEVVQEQC